MDEAAVIETHQALRSKLSHRERTSGEHTLHAKYDDRAQYKYDATVTQTSTFRATSSSAHGHRHSLAPALPRIGDPKGKAAKMAFEVRRYCETSRFVILTMT